MRGGFSRDFAHTSEPSGEVSHVRNASRVHDVLFGLEATARLFGTALRSPKLKIT